MVLPLNGDTDSMHSFTYYQGVVVSQLVCTIVLFIFLQALHFCWWGHDDEIYEWKKNQEGPANLQPPPPSQWKWDQKGWNMYFAIIFGNHISAVFLPMMYYPQIFTCSLAYVHFACFCGMLINNIFIDQKQPGKGGKTSANRVLWFLMCIANLALIVGGLAAIPNVIQ